VSEEKTGSVTNLQPSIFASRPDAWDISCMLDTRSLMIAAVAGALYCAMRIAFVGIGGSGAISIRPGDALFMLATIFGWPWAMGMVIGEFVASYFPIFGGYGFMDAIKQLITCLIKYPVIILMVKEFDPTVSKLRVFIAIGAMEVLIGNLICATYLNILYQIPIIAFIVGSVPGSIINEIALGAFLVFGLKKAGAHFLPARSG